MRAALALAAFALCFAAGLHAGRTLKKRAQLLDGIKRMLDSFAISMRYTAPTLDELAEGCDGIFATLLQECMERQPDIKAAWEQAVGMLGGMCFCHSEEQQLLRSLGRELGTCSADGQLSVLELYSERFGSLLEQAREDCTRKGKLFRSAGALAGAGAAILII